MTPVDLLLTASLGDLETTIALSLIFCLNHLNLCLKSMLLCLKIIFSVPEKLRLNSAKTPVDLVPTHGQSE